MLFNHFQHHARKASVFNMDVQYYNRRRLPREDEITYNATYCATLEELLRTSDVISVSCPLDLTTKGLLSHKEFSQMKDGIFFVNTARGAIIDEAALIAALESGKVARAGLDVFEDEPRINPYFVESDRCIIQPHLGGLTQKARRDAERECLENIKSLFSIGRPVAPVNEISQAT
jgi:lactate dehydrogenase-like 2-hydroxyacid dehydrogenase